MKKIITVKNIVRLVVLTPIFISSLYSVFYFFTHDVHPTYNDCGIIKSKSTDEVAIKYGSETKLYLNIEFEHSGFQSIDVDATTYFKHSVGDKICFDLEQETPEYHHLFIITGAFIIVCFGGLSIIGLLAYIFSED